jgi:hypothetical protein
MVNYKNKYLKYKSKYLKLKGGGCSNNSGQNIDPELFKQLYGDPEEVKYNTTVITKEMAEEDEALGKIYTDKDEYNIISPCANNNLDKSELYVDPYVDVDTMKVYKNPESVEENEIEDTIKSNISPLIIAGVVTTLLFIYYQ